MTTDVERAELRELATAATQPGPWSLSEDEPGTVLDANGMWLADVGPAPHDDAFIASMSPEVALGLLDEIDTLKRLLFVACTIADRNIVGRDARRIARVWRQAGIVEWIGKYLIDEVDNVVTIAPRETAK